MRTYITPDIRDIMKIYPHVYRTQRLTLTEAGQRVYQGVIESPSFRTERDNLNFGWLLEELHRLFGTIGSACIKEREESSRDPEPGDHFLFVFMEEVPGSLTRECELAFSLITP